MTSEAFLLSIGFFVLVVLSGTFSGSETALFSLDPLRLRRLDRSSRSARLIHAIVARPERLLAGILFGNTLVNVASSSVMLAITRRLEPPLFGWDPVTTSVVLATGILLVVGEILPKGLAVHWPQRTALTMVPFLYPLLKIIGPASRVLERAALSFLEYLGVKDDRKGVVVEWRELQLLFEDIQEGKEISEHEGRIASNIFGFFETRAHEVMTPRVDLVGVPQGLGREELRERAVAAGHSRLPVYRGSLDQIIGFLNTKEFLLDPESDMEALLHPVHFVPERARLHRILAEVQSRQLSLVVVVNEYGGTSGIITQEDLIEEIVGEIFDEQERDTAAEVEPVGEGEWKVAGLLLMEDLAQSLGIPVPESPADTVAGHVAHVLGRLPRPGDTVEDEGLRYRVLQVKRHRAQRVMITRIGEGS